jgi:hypothetical protein
MSKTYRTAMGKTIDMGSMVLANENVRAIGNQKVNARGDIIDSNNNVVKTRQQQLAEQYSTQGKKQNRPTNAQKPRAEKPAEAIKSKEPLPAPVPEEPVDFPEDVAEDDVEIVKEEPAKPVTGLAAAIAKTKETKKQ